MAMAANGDSAGGEGIGTGQARQPRAQRRHAEPVGVEDDLAAQGRERPRQVDRPERAIGLARRRRRGRNQKAGDDADLRPRRAGDAPRGLSEIIRTGVDEVAPGIGGQPAAADVDLHEVAQSTKGTQLVFLRVSPHGCSQRVHDQTGLP